MKNAGYVRNLENKFNSLLLKIQNDDELNKLYPHLDGLKGMRSFFAKHGGKARDGWLLARIPNTMHARLQWI